MSLRRKYGLVFRKVKRGFVKKISFFHVSYGKLFLRSHEGGIKHVKGL
jgi:hypothetical protein